MSKTFSFVIPTYNHYDLLNRVLYDIYQKCAKPFEVIVVNDNSDENGYYDGLDWWMTNGMLPVRHLRRGRNGGFILASNTGLRKAEGDIVCLLSNDVQVGSDIVTTITAMLKANPKSLVGGRLIDWDSGWNRFNNRIYPYIEGWLLAMTREGWQELDYLDEDLVPHDFEDVSLSTKALELDYTLVPLNDNQIVHLGAQSIGFNPEREDITRRNRVKFAEKYVR